MEEEQPETREEQPVREEQERVEEALEESDEQKESSHKKPLQPYFAFARAERMKVLEETPGLGIAQVSRVVAERWKNLDPAEKERHKKDFEEQMKIYKESNHAKPEKNVNPLACAHAALKFYRQTSRARPPTRRARSSMLAHVLCMLTLYKEDCTTRS
jgi:hypothetical protein